MEDSCLVNLLSCESIMSHSGLVSISFMDIHNLKSFPSNFQEEIYFRSEDSSLTNASKIGHHPINFVHVMNIIIIFSQSLFLTNGECLIHLVN